MHLSNCFNMFIKFTLIRLISKNTKTVKITVKTTVCSSKSYFLIALRKTTDRVNHDILKCQRDFIFLYCRQLHKTNSISCAREGMMCISRVFREGVKFIAVLLHRTVGGKSRARIAIRRDAPVRAARSYPIVDALE